MPSLPPPAVLSATDLEVFLTAALPGAPRFYGVTEVNERGVVLSLPIGPEHGRPGGTVSGPTMMGLADGAAWLATLSRIGPVPLTVTSSLTIHFLRKPPLDADLRADAELIRLGRRLSVTDVRISSGDSRELVAQATVTYSIPVGAGVYG
ncbi:MAG: PaaI family thioesterase [Acidimicrobiales bacterium]